MTRRSGWRVMTKVEEMGSRSQVGVVPNARYVFINI